MSENTSWLTVKPNWYGSALDPTIPAQPKVYAEGTPEWAKDETPEALMWLESHFGRFSVKDLGEWRPGEPITRIEKSE